QYCSQGSLRSLVCRKDIAGPGGAKSRRGGDRSVPYLGGVGAERVKQNSLSPDTVFSYVSQTERCTLIEHNLLRVRGSHGGTVAAHFALCPKTERNAFVVASCNADDRVINVVLRITSKLSNCQRSLNVVGIRARHGLGDCSVHFLLHNLGKAEDW